MASIDGFLDHYDAEPALQTLTRASLRSFPPRRRESIEPGNVSLWLLVALLHVGMFVTLEFAMRSTQLPIDPDERPLQVTFIEWANPPVPAEVERSAPTVRRLGRVMDRGIHAASARPAPALPAIPTAAPGLSVYDLAGGVQLPAVPEASNPVDPFSRRPVAEMLPGSDHVLAPGIHVNAELSPQHAVEFVGALFGGGHFDPCPEYEQRLLNAVSAAERDEQMLRYARACPGR